MTPEIQKLIAELYLSAESRRMFQSHPEEFAARHGVHDETLMRQLSAEEVEISALSTLGKRVRRFEDSYPNLVQALRTCRGRARNVALKDLPIGDKSIGRILDAIRSRGDDLGDFCGECYSAVAMYDEARLALYRQPAPSPKGSQLPASYEFGNSQYIRLAHNATIFRVGSNLKSILSQVAAESMGWLCQPIKAVVIVVRGSSNKINLLQSPERSGAWLLQMKDWTSLAELNLQYGSKVRQALEVLDSLSALESTKGK